MYSKTPFPSKHGKLSFLWMYLFFREKYFTTFKLFTYFRILNRSSKGKLLTQNFMNVTQKFTVFSYPVGLV